MASWFEQKIGRPLKNALKFVLGAQEIMEHPEQVKQHPFEGQMFSDPFGIEKEKVIPVSLEFIEQQEETYTEQNVYFQYVIIAAFIFVFLLSMELE